MYFNSVQSENISLLQNKHSMVFFTTSRSKKEGSTRRYIRIDTYVNTLKYVILQWKLFINTTLKTETLFSRWFFHPTRNPFWTRTMASTKKGWFRISWPNESITKNMKMRLFSFLRNEIYKNKYFLLFHNVYTINDRRFGTDGGVMAGGDYKIWQFIFSLRGCSNTIMWCGCSFITTKQA